MHKSSPTISIVSPFFNEEDMIDLFIQTIDKILQETGESYEIICVNDGSKDATLEKLIQAKEHYPELRIINLSRNFGKEAAVTAGLDYSKGEVIIPIDADLQDPPELIKEFIVQWKKGFDVVLAKRVDRSSDTFAKRNTAKLFYKFHNKISDTQIPDNVGDFRLITRRVADSIKQLPENQRFMRGIFTWVGFKSTVIEYKRDARKAGKTSYYGRKMWNYALDGITSFSTVPLKIWLYLGSIIALLSFTYGSFIILRTLIMGVDLPGYASLFTAILFLGGVQLIGLGILGEYVGRMYIETKRRPSYIIENEY